MRPLLVINPRSDGAFVIRTNLAMGRGIETAVELETDLRMMYPRAVVRERTLDGERDPMWYVYRDGAWVFDQGAGAKQKAPPTTD